MSARSNTRPAFVAFIFDPASQMVTKVDLARPRYEVQTRFYGDYWENCWLDELCDTRRSPCCDCRHCF